MSARPVSAPQLRAYLQRAREDGASAIGFRAAPVWDGDNGLGDDVTVVPCVSTLAVRAALVDHDPDRLLVILTDVEDIGQEALAKLWRRQLLRPDPFETVKHLFRVKEIAPEMAGEAWLADLLVDVAPAGRTYAPPPGGVLDRATAWRALLFHGLGLPEEQPTLTELLAWAATDRAAAALARFSAEDVGRIAAWMARDLGQAAGVIVQLLRSPHGPDVVPLGLVVDTLWSPTVDVQRAIVPRTLLAERFLPERLSDAAARAWGGAAVTLVERATATGDAGPAIDWTSRAETILRSLDAIGLVGGSTVLPSGFDARIEHAATQIARALDAGGAGMEEVLAAREAVGGHAHATRWPERVRRVDMAVRLLRRRLQPSTADPPTDLAAAAAAYIDEGAWIDEARLTLLAGDPIPAMGQVAHRLAMEATEERREVDRAFARALARWSTHAPTDGSRVLPIERVLEDVVAPLAASVPVLLLLIDGLAWAQAHRMFDDVAAKGLRRWAPGGSLPPVIAALPSITQVSRSSLFAGQAIAGGPEVEREGFSGHPALREVSRGRSPVLFHKSDLAPVDGHPAPAVAEAVADPEQRVVGVVVNAVDDHLDKGAQLELAEGLRAIRPLEHLLSLAVEADRAVVIVADHGHIRELGSEVKPHPGGERWRPADGAPHPEDEVLVEGPRVLRGDGRVILPATEGLRYNATKKLGYHGGATPQEVLCPLAVFAPATQEIDGWLPAIPQQPTWWDDKPPSVEVEPPPPHVVVEPPTDARGVPTLFGEDHEVPPPVGDAEPGAHPGWVQDLLDSDLFAAQRDGAGRQTLEKEAVAHLLTQLDRAGGTLTAEAFAQSAGVSLSRARGKATALATLLNIDGYPVITVDQSGEVRLDRGLLMEQFRLGER